MKVVLQLFIYAFQYLVVVPVALCVVVLVLVCTRTRFWGGYTVGHMFSDSIMVPWTIGNPPGRPRAPYRYPQPPPG